ncbi:restriction endonuclease subunit S [Caenimonas sp. SL110]|uniref:restriction endonuclease subunit S n=1 Tax=Caenimonas sp. SL110 TaxID=1450524 RepID=UPI000652A050|nr:restriction endonuclease subunit S [Caenimonas sp. SL110]
MTEEAKPALVPKLRFPEFQEAEPWNLVSLGEASTPVAERVGERNLTPVSISAGVGFVSQAEKFGRDISGNQYQLYTLVRDGDFVYNKGNSLKFPEGCVYLLQGWGQVAAPNVFICFRLKKGYSNGFFQNCFEANAHGKQLKKHITSGARSNGLLNISREAFYGVEIPTPSSAEQQKIADCLSSLDELIATQVRKVDTLKLHKRGLMQQLFPCEGETQPHLRFPQFESAGDWEVKKLEDLAKRGSGHTPSKSNSEFYGGAVKWISLADSKRLDAGLISETATEISEQGIKNSSAVLHAAGTVLVSRDAGVGKSAVMAAPMAVSQHFIVWTCHANLLSNWFLYYLLQVMKPIFERIATGSTIKTIGLPFFKELRLAVPALPEQQRIAESLTALDSLLTAATEELDALKMHKKGMMQQLFPSTDEVAA